MDKGNRWKGKGDIKNQGVAMEPVNERKKIHDIIKRQIKYDEGVL